MHKALIVDDERLICEGLRQIVSWDDFGLEPCLLAGSGDEALQIMRNEDIALLITDIKMPGMSGIELIREARRISPELKCIVLSGYHEFELVRSAMRAGAMDYLQKPVEESELTEAIAAVLTEDAAADHETDNTLYLQTMRHIFMGDIQPELQRSRLEYFNFDLNCTMFAVLAVCVGSDRDEFCKRLDRLQIPGIGLHTVLDMEGNVCVVLTVQTTDHANAAIDRAVNEVYRRLGALADERDTGVACVCPGGLEQLHSAYCEARAELDRSVMREIYGLHVLEGCPEAGAFAADLSPLRRALSNGDKAAVFAFVDTLLDGPEELKAPSHATDSLCIHLLNYALSVAASALVDTGSLPMIKARVLDELKMASSMQAVRQMLTHALGMIADFIESRWQMRYSPLINRVVQYTMESYTQKSLCLKVLADQLGVNPAYLGRQFKTETGEFYGDFLARLRIRRAEELLMTSYRNVSEIAGIVGFSSMATFGRAFRDITYMTPSDVRKKADAARKKQSGAGKETPRFA